MTKIKICGIMLLDDAARVGAAGVDFVGLNFWSKSKRHLALDRASMIAAAIRGAGAAQIVGVFVDPDPDDIVRVLAQVELDIIQLHGAETADDVMLVANACKRPVWKAIAAGASSDVERLEAWPVDAILLDTPTPGKGGSGVTFDWSIAREARRRHPARQFLLAGGLSPANVAEAIATVQPWAVDVASGVEAAPGIKDPEKLAAFVAAVRGTA